MKKNIAIIMGGYSSEYLISLKSGSVVFDSLTASLLYTPYCVHIFKDKWVYVDEKLEEHPVNNTSKNNNFFIHYNFRVVG